MNSVRVQSGATERIEALILDGSLDPLTGLTDILLSIRRVSDDFWLDFNDSVFKSTGWTTRQQAMTETDSTNGPGTYHYDWTTPSADETYEVRVDQSPGTSASNVPLVGEIKVGDFVDDIDAAISSRATQADILNDATPFAGANIDAAISSRATQADILSDATPFPGANIDAAISSRSTPAQVTAIETSILAAISALNDLSIADVQTALTNQGYTSGRAVLLDNLDAAISTVVAAVAALNDLSIADVQTALTNQGYTSVRAALLDNLDALVSSRATPADIAASEAIIVAAIAALNDISVDDVWEDGLAARLTEGSAGSALRLRSFEDSAVWVNDNGSAGTAFPIGTPEKPVSNFTDAITIAAALGLEKFVVMAGGHPYTLGVNLPINTIVIGKGGPYKPMINFSGFTANSVEFRNCRLTGDMDASYPAAFECEIGALTATGIQAYHCVINGSLTTRAGAPTATWFLYDCIFGFNENYTIDCNGSSNALVRLRQCRGKVTLINMQNAGASAYVDMDGELVIDATCTAGTIIVRGNCTVTNNGTATVIETTTLAAIAALNDISIADVQTALTNQGYTSVRALLLDNLDAPVSSVGGGPAQTAFLGSVWLDEDRGSPGTAFPIGTAHEPVDNIAQAKTIADANKLSVFKIMVNDTGYTLAQAFNKYTFMSPALNVGAAPSINGGGQNIQLSKFQGINLLGTFVGVGYFVNCILNSGTYNGNFKDCDILAEFGLETPANFSYFFDCKWRFTAGINFTGITSAIISIFGGSGTITLKNMTAAGITVDLHGFEGTVTIESSCTAGTINIYGGATVINNGGGVTVVDETLTSFAKTRLLTLAQWLGLR